MVRACIGEITTVEQRTRFMAYSSAVQFIGFAVVPGRTILVQYSIFDLQSSLSVRWWTDTKIH